MVSATRFDQLDPRVQGIRPDVIDQMGPMAETGEWQATWTIDGKRVMALVSAELASELEKLPPRPPEGPELFDSARQFLLAQPRGHKRRSMELLAEWAQRCRRSEAELEPVFDVVVKALLTDELIDHDWSIGGAFTVWVVEGR